MFSKCPKCGNSFFKVEENSPQDSNYKFIFIQCSSCHSVVGVTDYYNIGQKTSIIEDKINELSGKIDTISYDIAQISNQINSR